MDALIGTSELVEIEEEVNSIREESENSYYGVLQQFYKEIKRYKLLTPEEEYEIATRMVNGDKEAKEMMINCNLRLAASVARKYQYSGIEIEDLVQEACIGLMRATDSYNPNMGYKFSTYAFWWIRQAMCRYIDNHASTIRMPVHVKEKIRKLKSWESNYAVNHGSNPSSEIIRNKCKELEIPYSTYLAYCNTVSCVSLNQLVAYGDESDTELGDLLKSDVTVEREVEKHNKAEIVENVMNIILTPQEKWVLEHRFYKEMTLSECGRLLNLTRERVRQIERKAIIKMKMSGRRRGLLDLVR